NNRIIPWQRRCRTGSMVRIVDTKPLFLISNTQRNKQSRRPGSWLRAALYVPIHKIPKELEQDGKPEL
ncbi:MAG TPA: hypothetical protein PLQ90_11305, partial [Sphaerochaeta sp.]|nr:hypothetical protein [Sphaerochaeta sp.]